MEDTNQSNKNLTYGMCCKAGGGYIKVYDPMHPFSNITGFVLKHRWLLEKYLSYKYKMPIYLLPYFIVHHINGIKDDNRIENLEIMTNREHSRLSSTGNKNAKKDMANRFCFTCGSRTTSVRKHGYPRWYKHGDGFLCSKCYSNGGIIKVKKLELPQRTRYFIIKK